MLLINSEIPSIEDINTIIFDFDGIFTNNKVYIDQNGIESVRCDRSDGLGLDMMRNLISKNKLEINMFILSKESNNVVIKRSEKLKLKCHHGINNKASFIKEYVKNLYPNAINSYKKIMYLGNDLNDYEAIKLCGYSIVPIDSHPAIKEIATVTLNKKGGEGFVRDFVEKLLIRSNCDISRLVSLI